MRKRDICGTIFLTSEQLEIAIFKRKKSKFSDKLQMIEGGYPIFWEISSPSKILDNYLYIESQNTITKLCGI